VHLQSVAAVLDNVGIYKSGDDAALDQRFTEALS